MGLKELEILDITVDGNDVTAGAKDMLKIIRPKWKTENVKFKIFTEGITNKLVGCQEKSDKEKEDVILIRVFGEKTDLIIDREMELQNMAVLYAAGCARPPMAKFNNGIVYGFVPGEVLDANSVRDAKMGRLVAKEMVRIQGIDPERVVSEEDKALIRVDKKPFVFSKMETYLAMVPDEYPDSKQNERFKNEVKDKEGLKAEIETLKKEIERLDMKAVFTHNDLLLNNIIFNSKSDRTFFIDFEYGAFNYDAYDIGNHFCEWAGVDTVDYSLYPDKETQSKWLRAFLEEKRDYEGQDKSSITDGDVAEWYKRANKCALVAHMFWGIWGLIQARYSTIDFDYLDYAIIRFNEYFAKKEQFLAL